MGICAQLIATFVVSSNLTPSFLLSSFVRLVRFGIGGFSFRLPNWPILGRLRISIPVLMHGIFVDNDGISLPLTFLGWHIDTKGISLRQLVR